MKRDLTIPEKMFSLAVSFIGLQEIIGKNNNEFIVKMFTDIGHSWVKNDETAWCGCFINWLALKLNLSRSGKLDARSWLGVGKEVINPEHGDIVIFWRDSKDSWKGHVAVFAGYDINGNIYALGGNQKNEVNTMVYDKKRVLGFRRLINE